MPRALARSAVRHHVQLRARSGRSLIEGRDTANPLDDAGQVEDARIVVEKARNGLSAGHGFGGGN